MAKGFSLIEVLMALVIFTIGILGIISLQGIALMSTDFSGSMSVARLLATDQLERLSSVNFTASPLSICGGGTYCHNDVGAGTDGTPVARIDHLGNATPLGKFQREWTVVDTTPSNANAKQITVRVRWTDTPGGATGVAPGSFNRSLEITSIKINPS